MKTAIATLLLATPLLVFARGAHSVHGYVTKGGTVVAPHNATNPNRSQSDNWSSQGNVNPYTGKAGTRDPYAAAPATPRAGGKARK